MKKKMSASYIARTGILLALALLFQVGFQSFAQPAVGPLVNMVLILAALTVGPASGVIVGCFTPLVAFLLGIMPLFPLVPVIMLGNTLYVIVFEAIRKPMARYGEFAGVVIASGVKYAFLAFSVRKLLVLFMPKVPPQIVAAFSLPQLYTALVGGMLALLVYKLFKKNY